MDQLKAMKIFCRVAELNSYSKVSKEQGLSRSAVSRMMTQLEDNLAVKLMNRSTRTLHLTEAGQEFYSESQKLLQAHEALQDRMRQGKSQAKGILRIGVPGPLSERYLLPDLADFFQRYPEVKVSLVVSENLSDLYHDELDLVIRMGPLRDSSLGLIELAPLSFTMAASPAYLKQHGTPKSPQELIDHQCLCFVAHGRGTRWRYMKNGNAGEVAVDGQFSADCGYSLRAMAVAGQGILSIPTPLIQQELDEGSLIPFLEDYTWGMDPKNNGSISVLYHRDRSLASRIRCFLDWLKEPERLLRESSN